MDNRNPLGITEHGTSVSLYSQTQADRYRDAHRELFRHFLRTLKGRRKLTLMAGVALGLLSAKTSLGSYSNCNCNSVFVPETPKRNEEV